jgi:hypothetical protein
VTVTGMATNRDITSYKNVDRGVKCATCWLAGGSEMRRRVGANGGVMTGSSITRDGTTGTATLLRHAHRCLCTSGSIQGIDIPER